MTATNQVMINDSCFVANGIVVGLMQFCCPLTIVFRSLISAGC